MSGSPQAGSSASANDNADVQLVPLLIALSKSTSALLGLRLAAHGLRTGQDDVLLALSANEPIGIETLAEKLGVRTTTANTVIGHLCDKGLIARHPAQSLSGEVFRMTAAGAMARQKVIEVHRQLDADLRQSADGTPQLVGELHGLQARLHQLLSSLG